MNENFPKITIITPSYNQGQYIEQTILSVIEQNYPNLEYIIIDGGSTDNTIEIIKKYQKHIAYWVSEKDRGQSHAINKGISVATGDIFNWINSDDYLEKDSLQKIAEIFVQNPQMNLLCGHSNIFYQNNSSKSFLSRTNIYKTIEETLIHEEINQPGMFYKMSCIKELGGINESLHYVMDLELWFRYMLKFGIGNILQIDATFANFRIHENSKTTEDETKFRKEAYEVFSFIFESMNLPFSIIEAYNQKSDYYKPKNWVFDNIKRSRLLKEISSRYLFDFYKFGKTKAAKIAIIQQIKYKQVKLNKAYLSLFYRLFISNKKYGK